MVWGFEKLYNLLIGGEDKSYPAFSQGWSLGRLGNEATSLRPCEPYGLLEIGDLKAKVIWPASFFQSRSHGRLIAVGSQKLDLQITKGRTGEKLNVHFLLLIVNDFADRSDIQELLVELSATGNISYHNSKMVQFGVAHGLSRRFTMRAGFPATNV